jgi:hydroxymethylpyrimidine/phosphomethylpyrimidine kinase
MSAHGVYAMSVVVSVVAENTARVFGAQDISPDMIESQIDAVFEDIKPDAVKIGMLSSAVCMEAVAGRILQYRPENVVVDPVMYAKNGCALMAPDAVGTLVRDILPLADLLTPNIPEAEKIAGMRIETCEDMRGAAREIAKMGPRGVLVKGGHAQGDALDVLFFDGAYYEFSAPRIDTKNTHGTGCTYSSAIASNLALGMGVEQAVQKAKRYVTTAIMHALDIGTGHGPTHHFYELYQNGLRQEEENGL